MNAGALLATTRRVMRGRLGQRWPLLLALAFCLYSAALLGYSIVVRQQMRDEASSFLIADSKRRAVELGDRAQALSDTAQGYADLREIRDYLTSRDLGLSPRYGLDSSLEMISERFIDRAAQDGRRWGSAAPRIAYFDEAGTRLADTNPEAGPLHLPDGLDDPHWRTVDAGRGLLLAVAPVDYRNRRAGRVVVAAPIDLLYRALFPPELAQGYRELLMTVSGERLPGQESLSAAASAAIAGLPENSLQPLGEIAGSPPGAMMFVKSSVPELSLAVVTLVSSERASGHIGSQALFFVAGAVPLCLLFVAIRLDRLQRRNEQMQDAITASENERFRTAIRNDELAGEIRRREAVEQALGESEQRWQLAVAGTNDGVWDWNPLSGETFFSERWKSMLGYAENELANDVDEWQSRIHPDDRQRTLDEIRRHLAGETEFYQCEHRLRCKDGSDKWIMARGRALFDASGKATRVSGSHTDITQRRLAEERLQDRTEQLKVIFELSPDGFVSFDGARRVKYANPAFTRLSGIDLAQIDGLAENQFIDVLAPACAAGECSGLLQRLRTNAASDGAAKRVLIELAQPGKHILQLGLRSSDAGTVSQILYFRDVTHESEVDRMKSEFLSTAAHELRTPMASIYGFAEVLLAQDLDAASRQEFIEIIFRQSQLMAVILNELLDLARIEGRRGKDFVFKPTPVRELIDAVVSGFKLPAGRTAPTLTMADAPLDVIADDKKAGQAILNVLSNAYKYSAAGSPVSISVERSPSHVDIRIADLGIGMSPAQLGRVCERFYRADSSGKVPGTGLGMSIVKEIVDLHGGELLIESVIGQGTATTLRFPASAAGA